MAFSWDQARWRGGQQMSYERPPNVPPSQPPLSAPTAINPASQSAILGPYRHEAYSFEGDGPERIMPMQQLSTEVHTNTSAYSNARLQERPSPISSGNYASQQLANPSPSRESLAGAWRSPYHDDSRGSTAHAVRTPLAFSAPKPNDFPQSSSATDELASGKTLRLPSHQSLPSFATFSEHTANRTGDSDADGPEIAPMASRLSCYSCNKLKPLVREVAVAIAQLDENVQTYCNRGVTRTLDVCNDDPERAVQWILGRIEYARKDLQDASRRGPAGYGYGSGFQQQTPMTSITSRPASPSNNLKRGAGWDRDEMNGPKRQRSGASPDSSMGPPSATGFYGDHRASVDFAPRPAYSPTPTDLAATSAYPRYLSPGRGFRGPPSPSSLAYPQSVAPSLPPPTIQSTSSPALSYQPSTSIHTASTNSVTSAHIADLQHQVTLKTLSLQTLQSEYASLLQKLQRERVKSQTIEKKTSVADNEVNELTGRNEELVDQVGLLEARVEELEKKRETEHADVAREKEQWGRMLEMSGRLQTRTAADKQKLADEKEELLSRVLAYEDEKKIRLAEFNESKMVQMRGAQAPAPGPSEACDRRTLSSSNTDHGGNADSLKREVALLKDQMENLRSTIRGVRDHNLALRASWTDMLQQSNVMNERIEECLVKERPTSEDSGLHGPEETNERDQHYTEAEKATSASSADTASLTKLPDAAKLPAKHSARSDPASAVLQQNAANVGRAMSPKAAELGFTVEPTTSSPEESTRALGPLPTAGPTPDPVELGSAHGLLPQRQARPGWPTHDYETSKDLGRSDQLSEGRNAEWYMPDAQPRLSRKALEVHTHATSPSHLSSPHTRSPGRPSQDQHPKHYSGSPKERHLPGSPASGLKPNPNCAAADHAPERSTGYYTTQASRGVSSSPHRPPVDAPAFRHWDVTSARGAMPPPPRPASGI